jgi:hypothetical protein
VSLAAANSLRLALRVLFGSDRAGTWLPGHSGYKLRRALGNVHDRRWQR